MGLGLGLGLRLGSNPNPNCVYQGPAAASASAPTSSAAALPQLSAVVAQFASVNESAVRLLARSLRKPAHLEGVAALRELLAAQVVPHLESVGWQLGGALHALWREANSNPSLHPNPRLTLTFTRTLPLTLALALARREADGASMALASEEAAADQMQAEI